MNKMITVVLFVLGFSSPAFSQFSLGQPTYGGSACPAGSASVVSSDDGSIIKMLLDQFPSESDGRLMKRSCLIRIPAKVSDGIQIRQVLKNAKGFSLLPMGRKSKLEVKIYSSSNANAPLKILKTFIGPMNQDYELKNELLAQEQSWSVCGSKAIVLAVEIATEISVAAPNSPPTSQTFITLDDLDFQMQWRPCK